MAERGQVSTSSLRFGHVKEVAGLKLLSYKFLRFDWFSTHYLYGSNLAHSLHLSTYLWPLVLGLLASCLLISGVDDLVPLAICLSHWFRPKRHRAPLPSPAAERKIAIFVPCWKESEVIGNMVRHNLASIRYRNYDFFLGVYPNDPATLAAVEELSHTYRNVHVAVCPHPGPTSKADCLNAIYARMCGLEQELGIHFNTVVLHDAEDLIHPDALAIVNRERCRYAMVQVPVLPLPTPIGEFTHGIYCDEFAEFQTIDMPARFFSRSFIPSNGVGTGFARHILQRLAYERGEIFNPVSLTEDYEIGVYIHKIGHHQLFAPLERGERGITATREYFPRRWKSAIRQRTRWVTGIALQGWERDGWHGSWMTKYWFWRDRKGLLANPLSLITNVLCFAGLADWFLSAMQHRPWLFQVNNPILIELYLATTILQIFRSALRMACVARIFGLAFAIALPMRIVYGNFINSAASCNALLHFAKAKLRREPLVWLKTEHAYLNRETLPAYQRDLRDVLVSSGIVNERHLEKYETQTGEDLLQLLQQTGLMSDEDRCHALSLQSGIPMTQIDVAQIRRGIVQSLPKHFQKHFELVPFSIKDGRLMVASPRVPPADIFDRLKAFTRLPVDFQLVTQSNFAELRDLSKHK